MPLKNISQKVGTHWKPAQLIAPLVTLVMLVVTFGYWLNEKRESEKARQHIFQEATTQVTQDIQGRLQDFELVLRGFKGFYESSDNVTPSDYRQYFQALKLAQSLSSMQAVSLAVLVPQAQKSRHLADMQSLGMANYQIMPTGDRAQYAPIVLIEPSDGINVKALGFDLLSNPGLRGALDLARDSGAMALTGRVKLAQDETDALSSVVMYLPIYARAAQRDAVDQRRAALLGWVGGPFRLRELLNGLKPQLPQDLAFDIFDGTSLAPEARLFRGGDSGGPAAAVNDLTATRTIDLGGKRWTLVFRTQPTFENRFSNSQDYQLIVVLGVALSLLLGWLSWLLATGRERAVALATDMTQELRSVRADLEATLDALPDVLFELDLDGRYHAYRTSRLDLLAVRPEVLLGKLLSDVLPVETASVCLAAMQEANVSGFSMGQQIALQIGDERRWFELSVARKHGTGLSEPRFIVLARDITERKKNEEQLQLSAQMFTDSRDGIVITDAHNHILSINPAFTRITGFAEAEVLGKSPAFLQSGREDDAFYAAMWQDIQRHGYWQGEIWHKRKNGEIYPEWLSISAVKDASGSLTSYIGILSDLTERKADQERIDYLDHYDKLTHLPNRDLLYDRTSLALATSRRTNGHVAMLFVDIDRFQYINDSLGRPVGDQVLRTIAGRLVKNLQADDTVCRHSADEYILLLPNTDAQGAAHIASRVLALIKAPVVLDSGQELRLTASIGVAVCPDNGTDFEKLTQSAGAALKQAKLAGRDNYRFYAEQMHGQVKEILLIENQLRQAVAKHELLLYYQPQVDAVSGRIMGAEALIRWQHPEWGLVAPARFIPIAENSGQILEIGDWVLRTAVQQVANWQREGLPVVPVAVNLSALQFLQTSLCDTVAGALQASQLSPGLLELELTERIAMENSSVTVAQIANLHAMGVTLSIDDFGTGYSSMSYLKLYQIDKLKIDQSFVRGLGHDANDGAIVGAIIHMAHGLGFRTIAEGVETRAQLDYLRAQGCDEIQGYFFGRPLPADEFASLLRRNEALTGMEPGDGTH
ncbi:MAG: EAL domain-containing protein [Rhodoferax sp.]|nr:EAL domain-containing protein [Rhodoferax sp.]